MESYPLSESNAAAETGPFEELLTPREVAKLLKVPVSWVYDHSRRRGRQRIPCVKLGKYLRFFWPEVEIWLRSLREA